MAQESAVKGALMAQEGLQLKVLLWHKSAVKGALMAQEGLQLLSALMAQESL